MHGDSNIKYYLDDKEITEAEFKKLDSKNFKRMTVNKQNTDGKSSGEIRIETK